MPDTDKEWLFRKGIWLPPMFNLEDFLSWTGGSDVDEIPTFDAGVDWDEEGDDSFQPSLQFYINEYCSEFAMEFLLKNDKE